MIYMKALSALLASQVTLVTCSPLGASLKPRHDSKSVVNQTTCDGRKFVYEQLAGYGFVPSNAKDKFGDTLGGYGSSIAVDRRSWKRAKDGSYTGTLFALPDRGWYVTMGLDVELERPKKSQEYTRHVELSESGPKVLRFPDTGA